MTEAIKNTIIGYDRRVGNAANRIELLAAQTERGQALLKEAELFNLGQKLSKINMKQIHEKTNAFLRNEGLMLPATVSAEESMARNISARLGGNTRTQHMRFFDDAQRTLVAQKMSEGSINALRLSSVASMLGLSYFFGGPQGTAAALAGAAIVGNPKVAGGVLSTLRKRGLIKTSKEIAELKSKSVKPIEKKMTEKGKMKLIEALMQKAGTSALGQTGASSFGLR
jgi:hypothetical protein